MEIIETLNSKIDKLIHDYDKLRLENQALQQEIDFLKNENTRPIKGRVAFDNYPSQKVIEKCGFIKIGKDQGFANARQAEIEEYIYSLMA